MKIFLLIMVFGLLDVTLAQTTMKSPEKQLGFPEECQSILNDFGGRDSYYPTSMARVFNIFCPAIYKFTNCLEKNLGSLRNNKLSLFRIFGENFDKEDLQSKMSKNCISLKAVATQLECIKNDTKFNDCVQPQMWTLQKEDLTLQSVCDTISKTESCLRKIKGGSCPDSVVEFYIQYQRIFIPSCDQKPETETHTETVYTETHSVTVEIDSAFLQCVKQSFPAFISRLVHIRIDRPIEIASIIYGSVGGVCKNRTAFTECVKQRFIPPFSQIDLFIDKIMNQNALGTTLDQLCEVTISSSEQTCLLDSVAGMFMCGSLMTSKLSTISMFCPWLHTVNKCVRIQLAICSTSLAETFLKVEKELLTYECISVESPAIETNPISSVFVSCGLTFGAKMYTRVSAINSTGSQKETDTAQIVKGLISDACRFGQSYMSCIAREIVNSDSIFDKIAQKIFNLTDADRLKKIEQEICNHTSDIQDSMGCLSKSLQTTGVRCMINPKYQTQFMPYMVEISRGNYSALNDDNIRELCGPIKEIGLCEAHAMTNCSEVLSQSAEVVVNELLRTDCGGTRPLTNA